VCKGEKTERISTKELVRLSRAGRRDAFDELVRLYQRQAMEVAIRILGDANEAAEAVQNSFVKAFLNITKLKKPEKFETWLLRIMVNESVSRIRKTKLKEKTVKSGEYFDESKSLSDEQNESAAEMKEAIQKAMQKLSNKEAEAISLFGFQDLPHKEVAEIMDCTVESARWYVYSARKKLKVLLKEYLE